jgi:hypothetical protein
MDKRAGYPSNDRVIVADASPMNIFMVAVFILRTLKIERLQVVAII